MVKRLAGAQRSQRFNLYPVKTASRRSWVIVAIGLVLLSFIALARYQPLKVLDALTDPEYVKFWQSVLIGMSASYVAASVYNRVEDHKEERQLQRLRDVADPALTQSVISYIEDFNGRFMEDYHIRVRLEPIEGTTEALLCVLEYDYNKTLDRRHLDFKLIRVRNETQRQQQDAEATLIDELYTTNEYYYELDERTLSENIRSRDDLYEIRDLLVDNERCELEKSGDSWIARLPPNFELGPAHRVTYVVTFPFELDSYIRCVLELPTHRSTFRLDYSAVRNTVAVTPLDFLTPRRARGEIVNNDRAGEITIAHPGWTVPKSGVMFLWWKLS
jgi:hypothetical protein